MNFVADARECDVNLSVIICVYRCHMHGLNDGFICIGLKHAVIELEMRVLLQ